MSEKVGVAAAAAVVAMMLLFMHSDVAEAKNYVVAMAGGETQTYPWTVISSNNYYYPSGRKLKIGDTLEFIYNNYHHNVVGVGRFGYKNCNGSRGSKPYTTGNDTIPLKSGMNYFICTTYNRVTGNNLCHDYGMRIAVEATK